MPKYVLCQVADSPSRRLRAQEYIGFLWPGSARHDYHYSKK